MKKMKDTQYWITEYIILRRWGNMLNKIRVEMTKSATPMGSHGEFTCWRRLARRRWEICTILVNPVDFQDISRMIREIIVFIEDTPQLITFHDLSTCGDQRAWLPHV